MGRTKKHDEEDVKTLAEVEETLEEKNEELISDENIAEMEAPEEPQTLEEIKESFEETEIDPDSVDDGLEHHTEEEVVEEAIEPIKELVDEAQALSEEKDAVLESVTTSTPEEAEAALTKQIDKVEAFKKKLQDSFKKKSGSQIIHSWNGVNYSF